MSEKPKLGLPRAPADAPARAGRAPVRAGALNTRQRAGERVPARPIPAPAPSAACGGGDSDEVRISKRMAELGLASRREADAWIERGWVKVDGQLASLGQKVKPGQQISVDQAARHAQARLVTVLLHKPVGYVSGQAEDGHQPASVLFTPERQWSGDTSGLRFRREHGRGLAPSGRLDIDSTGLLVLTQDGRVARTLIGEDSDIEKEYLVRVQPLQRLPDGPLPEVFPAHQLARLNHGLSLDGKPLRPARVSWQNADQLRFVLQEGRKRQIRRMCELVGLEVVGLKRIRIGRVMLGHLPPGQWRYLGSDERFD